MSDAERKRLAKLQAAYAEEFALRAIPDNEKTAVERKRWPKLVAIIRQQIPPNRP